MIQDCWVFRILYQTGMRQHSSHRSPMVFSVPSCLRAAVKRRGDAAQPDSSFSDICHFHQIQSDLVLFLKCNIFSVKTSDIFLYSIMNEICVYGNYKLLCSVFIYILYNIPILEGSWGCTHSNSSFTFLCTIDLCAKGTFLCAWPTLSWDSAQTGILPFSFSIPWCYSEFPFLFY